MWEIDEGVIAQITEDVVSALHPASVFLFGSRANGAMMPDSDIDLMIVTDSGHPGGRFGQLSLLRQATRRHRVPIDFLIFRSEEVEKWKDHPTHILHDIMSEGRKLYEYDGRS